MEIQITDTGQVKKLAKAYIEKETFSKNLFGFSADIGGIKKSIEQNYQFFSSHARKRKILSETLAQQYQKVDSHISVKKNIDLLKEDNTFTVCTGHQICIHLGAAYTIYKIAQTIKLAQELEKHFPENQFVPIFWMATEDHDIDELFEFSYGFPVKEPNFPRIQNQIAGSIKMHQIKTYLQEIHHLMGEKGLKSWETFFNNVLERSENLVDFTRETLNELFGKYGVIAIDGNSKELKSEFSETVINDLRNSISFNTVTETKQSLSKEFQPSVNASSVNYFYLKENIRHKIEKEYSKFRIENRVLTMSEIEDEIRNFPERFSPNVITRPLYQQTILPNLSYVGGGGEISYWLILKKLFLKNKTPFPTLHVRNSFVFLDQESYEFFETITKKSLFFQNFDSFKNQIMRGASEFQKLNLEEGKSKILDTFSSLATSIKNIDKTLITTILGERRNAEKSLEKIEKKILKNIKNKHPETIEKYQKIYDRIFPNGTLQERHLNFTGLFNQKDDTFVENLVQYSEPFKNLLIIKPKKK